MTKRVIEQSVLDEMLHVGGMMSNVCWAIGQNQDVAGEQYQRDNARALQARWDAAVRKLPTLPKRKEKSR